MSEQCMPMISGLSACNALALNRVSLVEALSERRSAVYQPCFASQDEYQRAGLPFDPPHAAMPMSAGGFRNDGGGDIATATALLGDVIDAALVDAGLAASALRGGRVQLYIAGQGIQPDILQFAAYIQRNDREDLLLHPQIKNLHASTHMEEGLARSLMHRYGLARPPISLTTASCSSLSALYPACKSIERGALDLALVVSWQQVTAYHLIFMAGLNSLASTVFQPFSADTQGVMLGCGTAAAVLESPAHLNARGATGRLRVEGFSVAQSAGSGRGGQSFAPDFRLIARAIEESLGKSAATPQDISCVFAHGNGIRGSDQAELMAVRKVWGDQGIPVVSYKGQLGYQVAASGLTDLAILEDAMRERRLLGFAATAELDQAAGVHLHAGETALELSQDRITKVSLGIEGSIAVCTLGRVA